MVRIVYSHKEPESILGKNFESKLPLESFMKTWYELGKEYQKKADENVRGKEVQEADVYDVFRFMAFWIAITHMLDTLYGAEAECSETDERKRIKNFCSEPYVFNLLGSIDEKELKASLKIFIDNPVVAKVAEVDKNTRRFSGRIIYKKQIVHKDNPVTILNAIYTVRNNLVHGDKRLTNTRDRNLIESAANILDLYLGRILENEENFREYSKK